VQTLAETLLIHGALFGSKRLGVAQPCRDPFALFEHASVATSALAARAPFATVTLRHGFGQRATVA